VLEKDIIRLVERFRFQTRYEKQKRLGRWRGGSLLEYTEIRWNNFGSGTDLISLLILLLLLGTTSSKKP